MTELWRCNGGTTLKIPYCFSSYEALNHELSICMYNTLKKLEDMLTSGFNEEMFVKTRLSRITLKLACNSPSDKVRAISRSIIASFLLSFRISDVESI